jgi:peptide/nickel transport system substrate-binding protein
MGAVTVALLLVAAACGDDDDDDGDALATTTSAAAQTTAAPETTAAEAATTTTAGETTTTAAEAGCEATVPGSQLTVGMLSPTGALDPPYAFGSFVGGNELIALYDVLFRYNPETGEYDPQVAEAITPNDDFTEWTLELREGLTYSNGDPFDVDNLFASLDRFFVQGVRNASGGWLSLIESREKVDDYTAQFTLKQPWSTFQYAFADEPGMVVNTRVIGSDLAAFAANPPPEAGIGPYVLERNAPNEEVVFRARDDYWGGPVCVETLRMVFVPGARTTYDAYKNGDLDVAMIRDDGVLAEARADGEEPITDLQDGGNVILFNHAEGSPTHDPVVREAVILAIDENLLNERIFNGALNTGRSLIHPDSRYYTDAVEDAPPADAARAAELVEQAKAAGFDGRIRINATNSPPTPDVAISIEAQLEAVGFDVEQIILPTLEHTTRVVQGDFDLATWGYSIGSAESFTQIFFNFYSTSASNRAKYASPDMDAAIDAALAGGTEDERADALADISNTFGRDHVALSFSALEVGLIAKAEVQGIKATGTVMYLFDDVVIEE